MLSLLAINLKEELLLKEGGDSVAQSYPTPSVLISLITKNIFVISGVILFFFIIVGGMTMILNSGNADKQKQGTQTITNALIGFLLIFASYWIIRILEGFTGLQILEPSL